MCVLANLEYLSVLFCAVFWAAAPGLVAVLPMWDSAFYYYVYYAIMAARHTVQFTHIHTVIYANTSTKKIKKR